MSTFDAATDRRSTSTRRPTARSPAGWPRSRSILLSNDGTLPLGDDRAGSP